MKLIGLYNLEKRYINIALEKIRFFYKNKKDYKVEDYNPDNFKRYHNIFCSSLFSYTDKTLVTRNMIVGGTGFMEYKGTKEYPHYWHELPDNIEKVKPKINVGFTSRGCIRRCKFCYVPKKEGKLHPVGDIYDIWDGKSKDIVLLDNNILGIPKHFELIWNQIRKEGLKVREHGLDIRLLDISKAKILKSVRHYEYHFAFDNMCDEEAVRRGIGILKRVSIKRSTFYVLVGFNTTLEQDIYRLNLLRRLKQRAYVQKYNNTGKCLYYPLSQWANQKKFFASMKIGEFIKKYDKFKRYRGIYYKFLKR